METKKYFLKDTLTNMLEKLTPEVEKEFSDYILSTTVNDKALNLFADIFEFLEPVADAVGIPDSSYQVASDKFLENIKSNLIPTFFYHLALYHDLINYDHKVETSEQSLADNHDESSPFETYEAVSPSGYQDIQKFNITPDVLVTTYPPVETDDRKSIAVVIDYPSTYEENGEEDFFVAFFKLSVEVDEMYSKPSTLHFSTNSEVWEYDDALIQPIVFTLAHKDNIAAEM